MPPLAMQGRDREATMLMRFIGSASSGQGGAVVVHGEAGIGKTALMRRVLLDSGNPRTLQATGVEFEMDLPYAALHQLCRPILELRAELPTRHRRALEAAFGLRDEESPSPFLIGLALIGLLSEVSMTEPVVCIVDDAQWVDSASMQAFGFAARRVESERIAFLFAVRDPDSVPELARLPQLAVLPLEDASARRLLAGQLGAPLDDDVIERIVGEARGNPLALVELPRQVGLLGFAGALATTVPQPLAGLVEDGFVQQVHELPESERTWLLLAAADPLGDRDLVRRSALRLGLDDTVAERVEATGLVDFQSRIQFRHPLVRSATYRSAAPSERRRVHALLADATDRETEPDRRAWHRALATDEPDELVALELVGSADRATTRGGLAAAAAFLEKAANLTPDSGLAAARTLAAAELTLQAGAPQAAAELVDRIDETRLGPPERARAGVLRALIVFQLRRDAPATLELLEAADGLAPDRTRDLCLEVLAASRFHELPAGQLRQIGQRIADGLPVRAPTRTADWLLDGLLQTIAGNDAKAVPLLQAAVQAFQVEAGRDPHWGDLVGQMTIELHDDRAMSTVSERSVQEIRRLGQLAVLPLALQWQAVARVLTGEFSGAEASVAESHTVLAVTGTVELTFGDLMVASWCGDDGRVAALLANLRGEPGRGEPVAAYHALLTLNNGRGHFDRALAVALQAAEQEQQGGYVSWLLGPEIVEAAVRAGRPSAASSTAELASVRLRASGTQWALGTDALVRALMSEEVPAAEDHYEDAVRRLLRSTARPSAARAQLLYGEWLRRRGRRVDARVQLRAAYDALSGMGAEAFAGRARRELEASGEQTRPRTPEARDALTPQELQIARRVATGATSKQVASELFLSPRTIDAHLRNIFRKLDISSRNQLGAIEL